MKSTNEAGSTSEGWVFSSQLPMRRVSEPLGWATGGLFWTLRQSVYRITRETTFEAQSDESINQ